MMQKLFATWIQPIVLALGLLPMLIVLGAAGGTILGLMNQFDFLDVAEVMADISLITFTAMLACTPLNILFGWRWPLALRRPLGLYAFMYSAVHYLVFLSGFQFDVANGFTATAASNMLFFGFLGLALMLPLAMTSNKWSMQFLGRNWKRLHYLVYAIAIFIILHLLFLGQGALTAITYHLLLGIRIPPIRKSVVAWRHSWSARLATSTQCAPRHTI
ncbi:ferric reductase-like transmembrane domain-containing protein [Chloroflexi bacterium TSY]|nr:ferric reductase-like transmembrane domain-containing protein [Chloroflexi bacterium TSY]